MKKQNKKLLRFFKQTIHSNRHFAWAVAALIISGLALASYIYISNYNLDIDSVFSNLKSKRVYVDNDLKYIVNYPAGWVLEKDPSGNTVFGNPLKPSETITVTRTSLKNEGIIRHSINIKSQSHFTLPHREVYFINGGSSKDNSDITVAIIKTPLYLFYVTGHSDYFRNFVLNMRFF